MAEERVIKIVVDKKGADTKVKDLDNDIKKTSKSTDELSSGLDKVSGGAVSAFRSLKVGLKSAVTGFKSLRLAIIATGIGALIVGIIAVKQAFTSSEEGQNKFAKLMGIIGSVVGNLTDLLSDLGEAIIWTFENPKQAMINFVEFFKGQIVNRFKGFLNFIPNIGKAISLVFDGEFKKAGKVALDSIGQISLGVEGITDNINDASKALKEFSAELKADAIEAGKIADQRAKADKIDRNLLVERAVANRKIADLRLKSEQRDKFSTLERINFLKEANKLEEDITKKEIYSAQLRFNAKSRDNALSKSTKEDLDEEARLKAKLIDLETKKLNLNKRLETRIQSLSNEEKAKAKAEADRIQKQLDEEEKLRIEKAELEAKNESERLEKIAQIQDEFKKRREDEEAQTVLQKLELEKERKLLELEELKATEQQKADIIRFYDEKITKEKKEEASKRYNIENETEKATVSLKQNTLSLLGALAEKGSAIAKGLAVAEVVREQVKSVSNTIQSTVAANAKAVAASPLTAGQPFVGINTASAAVGIASGIATATKSIQSILGGSKTVSGGGGFSGGNTAPSAPSFNLVQGTESNQIAQSLSGDKQPVQAFVVGSNVTTQQELDRNKVEIGSI